jgi:glycosyltransferase involved in cell wall biosynthesis
MAVYNGAADLPEQLDSFQAQTHPVWHLLASDDGSKDASAEILRKFQNTVTDAPPSHGFARRVTLIRGPGQGAAANFLALLRHLAKTEPTAQWIAFSDQDDVWLPEKISRAVDALAGRHDGHPALYCSRTLVTRHDLSEPRLSAARPRAPGFRNALVQNIAAGNTIVLNPAASRLVLQASRQVADVAVHDWWVYQLVSGAGGVIVHDDTPGLMYRQHEGNLIGANDSGRARLKRIRQLLRGDFAVWNRANVAALRCSADALSSENRALLDDFARLPSLPLMRRLGVLRRMRLYRQTTISTVALWVAAVLGQI